MREVKRQCSFCGTLTKDWERVRDIVRCWPCAKIAKLKEIRRVRRGASGVLRGDKA